MIPTSKNPERDELIIKTIASGRSQIEAAVDLGLGVPVICGVVRRYRQVTGDWTFGSRKRGRVPGRQKPEPKPKPDNSERDAEILRLLQGGMQQKEVGRRFGMTQSGIARVLQRLRGYQPPKKRTPIATPQVVARDRLAVLFAEADRLIAQP